MSAPRPSLSDNPLDEQTRIEEVEFGFIEEVYHLAKQIVEAEGTFTVGIHGPWGSGKTSFCNLLAGHLRQQRHTIFKYNAWRYASDKYPLLPLLTELAEDESVKTWFKKSYAGFKALVSGFKANVRANALVGQTQITFDAGKAMDTWEKADVATVKSRLTDLFTDISPLSSLLEELRKNLRPGKRKLIIVIDDLDRCSPDHAVNLLEQLKLIFDFPGCVFVLALNADILDGFIRKRYKEEYGNPDYSITEYIEKLINLRQRVKKPSREEMKGFVAKKLKSSPEFGGDEDLINLVSSGSGNNPRAALRIINQMGLIKEHQGKHDFLIKAVHQAVWVAAPDLMKELGSSGLSCDFVNCLLERKDRVQLERFIQDFAFTRARIQSVYQLCAFEINKIHPITHAMRPDTGKESYTSILFRRGHMDQPEGQNRVLDLIEYYFDKFDKAPAASEKAILKKLELVVDYVRKFGVHEAQSDFIQTVLRLIMSRLATKSDGQLHNALNTNKLPEVETGQLLESCFELARLSARTDNRPREYLTFKDYEMKFKFWTRAWGSKDNDGIRHIGDLFSEYRIVALDMLRGEHRHDGETYAFIVSLIALAQRAVELKGDEETFFIQDSLKKYIDKFNKILDALDENDSALAVIFRRRQLDGSTLNLKTFQIIPDTHSSSL